MRIVVAIALLLAGALPCGAQGQSGDERATSASVKRLTLAQTAAIDRYIVAEMRRQRIPGAQVGIYRDGHIVMAKGYGLANVELDAPMRPNMLMQSGSIGKQFVATAIMMLVEKGSIRLDDRLTRYFPDAPSTWNTIRIANLLSHTSGLAEYAETSRVAPGGEFDLRQDFSEDQLAHKIEKLPIEFAPGANWRYRNTNYVLLGILIHRVTGRFYGDYLRDTIFKPLGMNATRIISDIDVIPLRSAGYEIKGGQLKNQAFVSATFNATADGTLYYNVEELEHWDRALYGTALLTRASLDRMWTPFVLNDGKPNPDGYGFGWMSGRVNGHRVVEHSGSWQGFTGQISRYVDDRLTVVVLTNLDAGHARPTEIERVIAGLVDPALAPRPRGPIPDDAPAISTGLRRLITETLAGADAARFFAPAFNYKFDPDDANDLRLQLPSGWNTTNAMVLIERHTKRDAVDSVFRTGPAGDTRLIVVQTDAQGLIRDYRVTSDPDLR